MDMRQKVEIQRYDHVNRIREASLDYLESPRAHDRLGDTALALLEVMGNTRVMIPDTDDGVRFIHEPGYKKTEIIPMYADVPGEVIYHDMPYPTPRQLRTAKVLAQTATSGSLAFAAHNYSQRLTGDGGALDIDFDTAISDTSLAQTGIPSRHLVTSTGESFTYAFRPAVAFNYDYRNLSLRENVTYGIHEASHVLDTLNEPVFASEQLANKQLQTEFRAYSVQAEAQQDILTSAELQSPRAKQVMQMAKLARIYSTLPYELAAAQLANNNLAHTYSHAS